MSTLNLASTETLRHATLDDLMGLLRTQADLRYDVVVPARSLAYDGGLVKVRGGALRFDPADEIVAGDAILRPTAGCEDQFADRVGIPTRYMRTMRADAIATQEAQEDGAYATALLDHNVNHWLDKLGDRRFLLRGFRTDDPDDVGVARALLSDRFGAMDHLDVLMAALQGINEAGIRVEVDGCDLTAKRMQVRVVAPEITALAPGLLRGYRSPFMSDRGDGTGLARIEQIAARMGVDPVLWAGLVIGNSETGDGAFTITPRIVVPICTNGMTIKVDALRNVHVGSKLDEGLIQWSSDTARKAIELITAKTRDAVTTFLSSDYLESLVGRIEEKSNEPVHPSTAIEAVSKQFGFTEAEQDTILAAFVSSGQVTAGGVMQAVTAAAQTATDPDRAELLEASALDVLEFAAAAAN